MIMEATIVQKDRILLVGLGFFGDPFASSGGWTEENEIGRLWNRFLAFLTKHGERIKHVREEQVSCEVHISHEETAEKGHFEVFVGVEVERLEDVPVEMSVKVLPPTQYAVFTLRGEQITSDWARTIYGEWMSQSGYEEAHPFMIQRYDARFKGLDQIDESELDIYVPVR
jgi:AraC family transcriptional regulator